MNISAQIIRFGAVLCIHFSFLFNNFQFLEFFSPFPFFHFTQRISAKDALDAEYFWTDPLPCDPRSLPKYESSHEFQTKKKRQQQRQNEEMAKRQKLQHPQQHARLIACFCRHDKEGNAGFVVFEFVDYALHPCPAVWLGNTSFLMRATS
ncbi:uncharacterized protein LOC114310896 isoform X2 [Camellia sinensis]|nr:uncharacterized protein LOC114310896 isoform X2 [Camellia sinensis]